MAAVGSRLYFVGMDLQHGIELWRTDGTLASTLLVKDIKKVGTGDSNPAGLVDVDGTLFFSASGTGGDELWKTDGTEAGTVRVKDINPDGSSGPQGLTAMDGAVYFTADDGSHGRELWKSDGTAAGTRLVRDIRPGPEGSVGEQRCADMDCAAWPAMASAGGRLLLTADDGVHGVEPWISDGTRPGTSLLADVSPSGGSDPTSLTGVGDHLYFAADDMTHGKELWSYVP